MTATGRRLRGGILALGLGATWLAQMAFSPAAAPLLDGVYVEDPYRFVEPPPGGAGDPLPVEVTTPVSGGATPLMAVATEEIPPQAQLIAQEDGFEVPLDATAIIVTLQPLAPDDPRVAGNVYRISVTDQAGTSVAIRPGALVSLVLRSSQANLPMEIARLGDDGWTPLPTEHAGLPDLVLANISELGDYAVLFTSSSPTPVASVPAPSPSAEPSGAGTPSGQGESPWLVVILALAAIGLGLLWGLLSGDER